MALSNEDKTWIKEHDAALVRQLVHVLTEPNHAFLSLIGGDPNYAAAAINLTDVMKAIGDVSGGGGVSAAQFRQIVRQEIDKTKLRA